MASPGGSGVPSDDEDIHDTTDEETKTKEYERALPILKNIFGSVTDVRTIQSVAWSCEGNLTNSIDKLMGLVGDKDTSSNSQVNPNQRSGQKSSGNTMNYSDKPSFKVLTPLKPPAPKNTLNKNIKLDPYVDSIIQDINLGNRVMVFMRGVPGSGKSTLAHAIVSRTVEGSSEQHIYSTDDFFLNRLGKYTYDVSKLNDAHLWNMGRVSDSCRNGISPIIIDNTNVQIWEMKPYTNSGVSQGYTIHVVEPRTPWSNKPAELARRNKHGVPMAKIKQMLLRYDKNITGTNLIVTYGFRYDSNMMPPQLRLRPPLPWATSSPTPPETSIMDQPNPIPQDVSTILSSVSYGVDKSHSSKLPEVTNTHDLPKPPRDTAKKPSIIQSNGSVDWRSIDSEMMTWSIQDNTSNNLTPNSPSTSGVDVCDAATMTNSNDNDAKWGNRIYLTANSRDINFWYIPSGVKHLSKKMTLDKSTMLEAGELEAELQEKLNKKTGLQQLQYFFPSVPEDDIEAILDTCNGDVDLAYNLLQPDNNELIDLSGHLEKTDRAKATPNCAEIPTAVEETHEDAEPDEKDKKNLKVPFCKLIKKDKLSSETAMTLKKDLEESFSFEDSYYSNHVLKLKNRNKPKNNTTDFFEEPSTSGALEEYSTLAAVEESAQRSTSESSEDAEDDPLISVTMGKEFFAQLHELYGTYNSDDLDPIIHMPKSFLNQLHALWLESVCDQMDARHEYLNAIMKEDEEFARKLEESEYKQLLEGNASKEPEVPNLKEIMDMEMALAVYNSDMAQWKNQTPDDLASKLSRKKLIELFPEVDKDVLLEIYNAYDNNFEQTIRDLLKSTGRISALESEELDQKAMQKILANQEDSLVEKAKREREKATSSKTDNACPPGCSTIIEGDLILDKKSAVEYYRNEARHQLQMRNQLHAKAQEYFHKGMNKVAAYYSQMATLHTKKHDHANNMVASGILQISIGEDAFTLDLHHLYVSEAMQVLDVFLDDHIQKLRSLGGNKTVKLFLITGRGKHSPGGTPRIKPAVKRRLMQRKLKCFEFNSGLLNVTVSGQNQLSILRNEPNSAGPSTHGQPNNNS